MVFLLGDGPWDQPEDGLLELGVPKADDYPLDHLSGHRLDGSSKIETGAGHHFSWELRYGGVRHNHENHDRAAVEWWDMSLLG